MTRTMAWTLGTVLVMQTAGLAQSRQEKADQYTKELANDNAKVRAAAAEELGKLGQIRTSYTRAAIPKLMELLKDKDTKVRAAAAEALGKIDPEPEKAVPALLALIKNDKEEMAVRTAAIRGVSHLGAGAKPAMSTLRELSKDQEQRQLSQAARAALKVLNVR